MGLSESIIDFQVDVVKMNRLGLDLLKRVRQFNNSSIESFCSYLEETKCLCDELEQSISLCRGDLLMIANIAGETALLNSYINPLNHNACKELISPQVNSSLTNFSGKKDRTAALPACSEASLKADIGKVLESLANDIANFFKSSILLLLGENKTGAYISLVVSLIGFGITLSSVLLGCVAELPQLEFSSPIESFSDTEISSEYGLLKDSGDIERKRREEKAKSWNQVLNSQSKLL